jgi:GDP-mannose 6-dehydrogenase
VRIYDANVSLSRLVGGNRAFIESAIPHIACLMCQSMEEAIGGADIVVVAHRLPQSRQKVAGLLRPGQLVLDFGKNGFQTERVPAASEVFG